MTLAGDVEGVRAAAAALCATLDALWAAERARLAELADRLADMAAALEAQAAHTRYLDHKALDRWSNELPAPNAAQPQGGEAQHGEHQ